MSLSTFWRALCVIVVLCCCSTVAQAALINIDINGDSGVSGIGTYTGTAAAGGGTWNGYDIVGTVGVDPAQSGFLLDSTGAATTVKFDLSTTDAGGWDGFGTNKLMSDYASTAGAATPTFALTGLVAGNSYDLYAYCGVGTYSYYPATFTLAAANGGASKTSPGDAFAGTFTEDVNYVKFSGVTADVNGAITGTFADAPDSNNNSGMCNGLQIVNSIPEPGTIVLLTTGVLGLLAYAWRKRK